MSWLDRYESVQRQVIESLEDWEVGNLLWAEGGMVLQVRRSLGEQEKIDGELAAVTLADVRRVVRRVEEELAGTAWKAYVGQVHLEAPQREGEPGHAGFTMLVQSSHSDISTPAGPSMGAIFLGGGPN